MITTLGFYGADGQVAALADEFVNRGWDVGIVSMVPPERPIAGLRARGVRIANLGMRRGLADPRAVLRLRRVLRAWRPQIVHSHMVHANLLTRVTRLVTEMPVLVSTGHSFNEGATWRYLAYRATYHLSDATTNVSHAAAAEATRRGAAPRGVIRVIPNGIDVAPFAPSAEGRRRARAELGVDAKFMWLAVGRLVPAKDYPTMLAAFARLGRREQGCVLLIAGTGPLQSEIERRIAESGLESSVRLLGLREDIPTLMHAADGYVMSSRWEGLPVALLEASAAGVPIVATDVGGNSEAVVNRQSGLVVPAADADALSRAMTELMDLPGGQLAEMGRVGRDFVSRTFDIQRVVDRWMDLYAELSARRPRRQPASPSQPPG